MINKILHVLQEFLKETLGNEYTVLLDAIDDQDDGKERDVVITLIRIEEETSRKAMNTFTVINNLGYKTSPDLALNLDILISSQSPIYETALKHISTVVSLMNSIQTLSKPSGMSEESFSVLRSLNVSILNLSLDQSLNMWQTLRGKLMPAVAYKVRMLTIPGVVDEKSETPVQEFYLEKGFYKQKKLGPHNLPGEGPQREEKTEEGEENKENEQNEEIQE